jgi:hypothetical protein
MGNVGRRMGDRLVSFRFRTIGDEECIAED